METSHTKSELQRDEREVKVILFALVLPTLVTLLYFVLLASATAPIQLLGYGSKVFQFALPILWVVVVRREEGFRLHNGTTAGVAFGFAFGFTVSMAMLALYFLLLKSNGWMNGAMVEIRDKVTGLGVNRVWKYLLMAAFYSVIHSLLEEYYWRWFVFGRMRRWWSLATAVVVSSLAFMAHHVLITGYLFGWTNPLTYFLSISVAVGGAVWALLYQRSQNMLGPWLSHLLIDAAIFGIGFDIVRDLYG